jgi:hypothetical protein
MWRASHTPTENDSAGIVPGTNIGNGALGMGLVRERSSRREFDSSLDGR